MTELGINLAGTQEIPKTAKVERAGLVRLRMGMAERRVLLMLLDLVAVNAALVAAFAVRPQLTNTVPLPTQATWFVMLSALWLILGYPLGAYDLRVSARLSSTMPVILKCAVATAVIYVLIPYITPALPASRMALSVFFVLACVLPFAGRVLYRFVLSQPVFHQRSLIVGCGWAGQTIARVILEHDDPSHRIAGFVEDGAIQAGADLTVSTQSGRESTFPVLGDRYALRDLVVRHQVTNLILASSKDVHGELLETLMDCLELGVEIIPMPILYERLTGLVPVEHVGGNWYVGVPIHHPGTGMLWSATKRAMDLLVGLAGLLVLGLITPVIAAAIRLDSRGPIFYSQARVGKGGRTFRVHKFRSMIAEAEKGRAQWAREEDPRVTSVGRLLRLAHLDELPQFVNVLKGEMSVVGPRPERPEFVEELAREIPFYRVRHAVKPGCAGWGLINQGYGASKNDALVKLQYDLYYIKHQSLWLDLYIILKAIMSAVTFNGR